MANKKFNKAAAATAAFEEVNRINDERATVIVLENVHTDNLIDHEDNGEDITNTIDLETSIREVGFIDPIEVTSFGMDEGKYMIISGRRRRAAGLKLGITVFPCLVRPFDNAADRDKYVLYANNHRDSDSDPLLRARRYRAHVEQLKVEGYKGGFHKLIASRMGLSVAQADRYEALNKVIEPIWEMITNGTVGVSSVLPMASHHKREQGEILLIFAECLEQGGKLTRETVKLIVDSYRDGKRTWADIEKDRKQNAKDSGIPLNAYFNTDPGTNKGGGSGSRNSEVRREFDPVGAEADRADKDRAEWERGQQEQGKGDTGNDGGEKPPQKEKKPSRASMSDDEKQLKNGKDLLQGLGVLDALMTDGNTVRFENPEEAGKAVGMMGNVVAAIIGQFYSVTMDYGKSKEFRRALNKITDTVKVYDAD